ncbi:MAG: TylF/MycF/NovP-related O-methyltransferase [Lachnospiraceae bacterium]
MQKAICFGAAGGAKRLYQEIIQNYEVIGFADNDRNKWGTTLFSLAVMSPQECLQKEYEVIIITSAPGLETIRQQLLAMGVRERDIISHYVSAPLESRKVFLEKMACLQKDLNEGICVAEAGVFEGDFARWINAYYPSRTLHLFDTFEGFDARDISKEGGLSEARSGEYSNTTTELVMSKMSEPEMVKIHKGFFPETAAEIQDHFCFVNLDLDLYEPTYRGLRWFQDKMVSGGVILVHDYFAENFKGPRQAVEQFLEESEGRYHKFPIGDGISIMVTGF